MNQLLAELRALAANITQAYDLAKDTKNRVSLMSVKPELLEMQQLLNNNLDILKCRLNSTPCDKHYMSIEPIKQKMRLKILTSLKQSISDLEDWFKAISLIYSMRKANENIQLILEAVEDIYSEK